jgi:ribosomal protein S18 acetylase RimI-like enzyme
MEPIHYRKMEVSDWPLLQTLIADFYQSAGQAMSNEKITHTLHQLQTYPETGTILVFETSQSVVVGYSILINFWSNEYGGNILVIDELYLSPDWRGQGIGSAFFEFLIRTRFNNWVGLELEVLPYNAQALRLYEKIGFQKSDRSYLLLFEE